MCACSRETEFLAYLLTSSAYVSSLLSSSILPRMVLIFLGQSSPGRSLGVAHFCSAPSRASLSRGIGNLVLEQLIGNVSSSFLVCRQTRPEILWIRKVSTPKYCFDFGHSTITSSSIPQSSPFFNAWLSGVLSRSGRYISVVAAVSLSCLIFLMFLLWFLVLRVFIPCICHISALSSVTVSANFLWIIHEIGKVHSSFASCTRHSLKITLWCLWIDCCLSP